ncbi:MAG: sigma-70 family RNA polymerase sigma factor [Lentisphaerales bacterium]|nr:sigma-70 family RNA polymerase sigma factor [Lentisphaerales bacterium]
MSQLQVNKFDQVFEACYTELTNYAYSHVKNRQNAQDIVHDAYLKAMKADSRKPISNIRAFLYRVIGNLVIDQARKTKRRQSKEDAIKINEYLTKEAQTPYQLSLGKERKSILRNAIDELPLKCREVFTLQKISQLSQKEISQQLGISTSTIEKHIIKAMRHCRSYVKSRV